MTDDLTPNELRDLERRVEAAAATMTVEELAYIKGVLDDWTQAQEAKEAKVASRSMVSSGERGKEVSS
jgi:hypothetical protein